MGSYRAPEPWFPSSIRELWVCDTCTQGQRSQSSQPDVHLSGGPYIIANLNRKNNNRNTNRSIYNICSNLPKPHHVSIVLFDLAHALVFQFGWLSYLLRAEMFACCWWKCGRCMKHSHLFPPRICPALHHSPPQESSI